MNKIILSLRRMLIMIFLCAILVSCSTIKDRITEYSSYKEQCFLDSEDVTKFIYNGNSYSILDDIVSNENLGEWIGYIRQLAAVDEEGTILVQENIEDISFETLTDLADKAPDAKYIIPFLNVYAAPNDASYLIIDVNAGYHKAVPSRQITDIDCIFNFKAATEKSSGRYEINPQNATQLICGNKIYQVTSELVSKEKIGIYIDILAEKVTFDAETKIQLTKDELNKVEWSGTSSRQKRENWFYMDVHEIFSIDRSEAVAVKVNNQYYVAKVQ